MRIVLGEDVSDTDNDVLEIVTNRDGTVRVACLRVPSGGGGGLSGYLAADLLGFNLIDAIDPRHADEIVGALDLPDSAAGPRANLDRVATLDGFQLRYVGTPSDGDFWIVRTAP